MTSRRVDCPSCGESLWCNLCGEPYEEWPDYAAALRLHQESQHPIISGAQCDNELAAVKLLVNAALGIGGTR